jgi:hypothetical protein
MSIALSACGYAGSPPHTKPGNILVTVSPTSVTLAAGSSQQFQAIVSGTTNTSVNWLVNGIVGGKSTLGTISTAGLYTAPANLPSAAGVTVTAASVVNSQSSASAAVTFENTIALAVAPVAVTVPTSGAQVFTVSVSGAGSASSQVTWSVNGIAGGNAALGTIASNSATTAIYTAPASIPAQNPVTVTATSVSNPAVSASATVTLSCAAANSISPSSINVSLGATQSFSASLCIASSASIVWDVNGIVGGNSSVGTIAPTGAGAAAYTAPASLPSPNPVTVHATSGTVSAAATVTIVSDVTVSVAPASATMAPSQSITLTPTVVGSADANVSWTVNGVANGNATVGQICVLASNPCTPPAAPGAAPVTYVAPAAAPTQDPVTVTATSQADASRAASAQIQIAAVTANVAISIGPRYGFVPPSSSSPSTLQLFANVTGASNATVSWSLASGVAGQTCSASTCGSITVNGLFTAPPEAPSPNVIYVTATSQADNTKSATSAVAITSGPTIETILPSSVSSGSVEGFPLEVQGVNFVAGSGSNASTILVNGVARATTCPNSSSCATAVNPDDVATAAILTVQVQNPPPSSPLSNPVPFVVIPFDASVGVISLSSPPPSSGSSTIHFTIPEPTTAAASAPLNVDLIGYLTGGDNCGIGAAPLSVSRPASGSITFSICIHGNNLDPLDTFTFTGAGGAPAGTDIPVTASAITGLFPNMIELDLQISSDTQPGLRTLFITTLNGDSAAATGMLEVQ